jgi:hypothetical protein
MRLCFSAAEYLAMNKVARLYSLSFQPSTLIVPSASAWLPMGCAETLVMRLPDDHHQTARDPLAHRPWSAGGPRRTLAGHSP